MQRKADIRISVKRSNGKHCNQDGGDSSVMVSGRVVSGQLLIG